MYIYISLYRPFENFSQVPFPLYTLTLALVLPPLSLSLSLCGYCSLYVRILDTVCSIIMYTKHSSYILLCIRCISVIQFGCLLSAISIFNSTRARAFFPFYVRYGLRVQTLWTNNPARTTSINIIRVYFIYIISSIYCEALRSHSRITWCHVQRKMFPQCTIFMYLWFCARKAKVKFWRNWGYWTNDFFPNICIAVKGQMSTSKCITTKIGHFNFYPMSMSK